MNLWAETRVLRQPSTLTGVEAKKQIKQRIGDNRAIATNGTGFELGISNRKKRCKNSLRPQPKLFNSHGIRKFV
jgi:hypothetical protein